MPPTSSSPPSVVDDSPYPIKLTLYRMLVVLTALMNLVLKPVFGYMNNNIAATTVDLFGNLCALILLVVGWWESVTPKGWWDILHEDRGKLWWDVMHSQYYCGGSRSQRRSTRRQSTLIRTEQGELREVLQQESSPVGPSLVIATARQDPPLRNLGPTERRNDMSRSQRDRPFKCTFPDCNWTFMRAEHLTRHLRVHSGERPFACDHPGCISKFARTDELKRHKRLVHMPASTHHEAALADNDRVVYNGQSRRQAEQFKFSFRYINASAGTRDDTYFVRTPFSSSNPEQLPPLPAKFMNPYSSSDSYGRHQPSHHHSSSRVVQPSPLRLSYGGGGGGSVNRSRWWRRHEQPLSFHHRARSWSPVTLPPLRTDVHASPDNGREERRVRLPGFSEVAGKPRYSDSSRREHETQ